jgi:hypothetical protein
MSDIVINFEVPQTTAQNLRALCKSMGLRADETEAVLTQLRDAEPGAKTVVIARPA